MLMLTMLMLMDGEGQWDLNPIHTTISNQDKLVVEEMIICRIEHTNSLLNVKSLALKPYINVSLYRLSLLKCSFRNTSVYIGKWKGSVHEQTHLFICLTCCGITKGTYTKMVQTDEVSQNLVINLSIMVNLR